MKRVLEVALGKDAYQRRVNPKVRKLAEPIVYGQDRICNEVIQSILTENDKFDFSVQNVFEATALQASKVRHLLEICTAGAPVEHELMNNMALLILLVKIKTESTPQHIKDTSTIRIQYDEPQSLLWTRLNGMADVHANNMFVTCRVRQRMKQ